ncbi:MAG: immune inhibitor A, partial [Pontiellaceae bacterium]|nr:immune inhibitor A [Pontiellaceae bacterium]
MNRISLRLFGLMLAALWGIGSDLSAYAASYLSDTFESGMGLWSLSGSWNSTVADAYNSDRAATDSPGAFYSNNSDSALTLSGSLNLSTATHPALMFFHRYSLEENYDYARVEVSVNDGADWAETAAYTGVLPSWSAEQIDLSAYAGESSVKIRFRLSTDSSVVMDGWYLDDLLIDEMPDAAVLTNAEAAGVSSVLLEWSASSTPNVQAYRIYRSLNAGFSWEDAVLAGEVDGSTLSFVDIAAAPKQRFYYRVTAVAENGLTRESNELSVLLPAGMDYPFIDTAEVGGTYWIADGGWSISDEDARDGSHCWTDSAGSLYSDALNASLRLAVPMSLADSAHPVLTFYQKHQILNGDAGVVEVSVNNGSDWTALKTYSGSVSTNDWTHERIALDSIAGSSSVLVRFRLTTDASGQGDGWWIDDISLAESPSTVASTIIDDVQSHSLRLSWPQNSDTLFSHYAVHRVKASSGVGHQSERVAEISDQLQTQWSDSGLDLNTIYTYRVYAVSPYGTYSADGAEASDTTANNPLPFSDGFETGNAGWTFAGSWAVTTETNASGGACLTDSPLGYYPNNQNGTLNYALTSVDLSGTTWPVLTFKDRHA